MNASTSFFISRFFFIFFFCKTLYFKSQCYSPSLTSRDLTYKKEVLSVSSPASQTEYIVHGTYLKTCTECCINNCPLFYCFSASSLSLYVGFIFKSTNMLKPFFKGNKKTLFSQLSLSCWLSFCLPPFLSHIFITLFSWLLHVVFSWKCLIKTTADFLDLFLIPHLLCCSFYIISTREHSLFLTTLLQEAFLDFLKEDRFYVPLFPVDDHSTYPVRNWLLLASTLD